MQGVVWSSFPLKLNSILQVRTGYGHSDRRLRKRWRWYQDQVWFRVGDGNQAALSYRTPFTAGWIQLEQEYFRMAIKAPASNFVFAFALLSLWLQAGKYPKVWSPQSRKLKLVLFPIASSFVFFFNSVYWLIDRILLHCVVKMVTPYLPFFFSR